MNNVPPDTEHPLISLTAKAIAALQHAEEWIDNVSMAANINCENIQAEIRAVLNEAGCIARS